MVFVFKTNVSSHEQARQLYAILIAQFPTCKINFDLDDCDKILRLEGNNICASAVMHIMGNGGFDCQTLK